MRHTSIEGIIDEQKWNFCNISDAENLIVASSKVGLVDPHSLTRRSITHLLEASTHAKRRSEDFVILPFQNPDELLACFPGCGVELVLLSIGSCCPSDDKTRDHISQLKQGLDGVPLIILSEREELHCVLGALRLGAHSYIPTMLEPEVVIQALHLIQAGGRFVPVTDFLGSFEETQFSKQQTGTVGPILLQGFTPRQLEVLQLLRTGKSNKIIA